MAINLQTFPSGTAPYTGAAWQNMIDNLLGAQMIMPGRQILTDWTAVTSGAQIAQGTYFMHAGSLYLTETSNESISGSVSAGFNYLKLSVSGTTLVASWVTTLSGYSYDPAYQGWYNAGGDQIILNGIYLDGTNYRRYVAQNYLTPHIFIVANYGQVIDGKILDTLGGDINTSGGDVNTSGGDVDTSGGDILSGGGDINSEGGLIDTDGGSLDFGGIRDRPFYYTGTSTLGDIYSDMSPLIGSVASSSIISIGVILRTSDNRKFDILYMLVSSGNILLKNQSGVTILTASSGSTTTLTSLGYTYLKIKVISES